MYAAEKNFRHEEAIKHTDDSAGKSAQDLSYLDARKHSKCK
jgi:hypothetical protein